MDGQFFQALCYFSFDQELFVSKESLRRQQGDFQTRLLSRKIGREDREPSTTALRETMVLLTGNSESEKSEIVKFWKILRQND